MRSILIYATATDTATDGHFIVSLCDPIRIRLNRSDGNRWISNRHNGHRTLSISQRVNTRTYITEKRIVRLRVYTFSNTFPRRLTHRRRRILDAVII